MSGYRDAINFQGTTDGLVVNFYWKSVLNHPASREQGMRIYEDKTYVKMFRPGEMQNIIDRPIEPADKHLFKTQWDQFQLQKSQVPEGTPIDLLFPNHPAVADTLRGMGVHTVQQAAGLSAHAIDSLGMGGQEYVNKAQAYIKAAGSGKETLKMQEELKAEKAKTKSLERSVAELTQQVQGLMRRMSDPTTPSGPQGMPNPGYIAGYDAQADRIDSSHPTAQMDDAAESAATSMFKRKK
jgi:hypothetical protein